MAEFYARYGGDGGFAMPAAGDDSRSPRPQSRGPIRRGGRGETGLCRHALRDGTAYRPRLRAVATDSYFANLYAPPFSTERSNAGRACIRVSQAAKSGYGPSLSNTFAISPTKLIWMSAPVSDVPTK